MVALSSASRYLLRENYQRGYDYVRGLSTALPMVSINRNGVNADARRLIWTMLSTFFHEN